MILDTAGLTKTVENLHLLKDVNASDLMVSWSAIIDEDNRRGILQGLDADGVPMVPVTYRPKPPGPLKPTAKQRGGQSARAKKGKFVSFGTPIHGNLSSAEYKLLGGPPLAPRDQFSRVITNFSTDFAGPPELSQWQVIGVWLDVLSTKGMPFLRYHFHTVPSRLPRRNLIGIRPEGMRKALDALSNWARLKLREIFG